MKYRYDRDLDVIVNTNKYRYDKIAQEWLAIKQPKSSRFERKMWQVSVCVVIAVIVMVADAIAGGF